MVSQEHLVLTYNVYMMCICFKNTLNYGIGKHNCLWCEISSDRLKVPLSERGPSQQRSLQSLQRDYSAFIRGGGDIRLAKNYRNVIQPYFFEIPLNQVPHVHVHVYICIHVHTHTHTHNSAE